MPFPRDLECPITGCHYFIASANQNFQLFNKYINNALQRLDKGEKLTFSLYSQFLSYSHDSKEFILIQVAECFDEEFFTITEFTDPISVNLRNGMILISPFEDDMVQKLSKFFCHKNIRIISFDIFLQLPILTKENIQFDLSKVLDWNYTSLTGQKTYNESTTLFVNYCKAENCIEMANLRKNKKRDFLKFFQQNQLRYKLYNIDNDPFKNGIDENFYNLFINIDTYVSIALFTSIEKYGLKNVQKSTSEKVKAFNQTKEEG